MFPALFSWFSPFLLQAWVKGGLLGLGESRLTGCRNEALIGALVVHGSGGKILKVHLFISTQFKILYSELNVIIWMLPLDYRMGRNAISFALATILLLL